MDVTSHTLWPGILTPDAAERFAYEFMAEAKPKRWARTQRVVQSAKNLAGRSSLSGREYDLLLNAAWMHDIGSAVATGPKPEGWNPIIGAIMVRSWGLEPVSGLIAWNGVAEEESMILGTANTLHEFTHYMTKTADLLLYADMHTDLSGNACSLEQRLIELRAARGGYSTTVTAFENAWDRLKNNEKTVEFGFLSD